MAGLKPAQQEPAASEFQGLKRVAKGKGRRLKPGVGEWTRRSGSGTGS